MLNDYDGNDASQTCFMEPFTRSFYLATSLALYTQGNAFLNYCARLSHIDSSNYVHFSKNNNGKKLDNMKGEELEA